MPRTQHNSASRSTGDRIKEQRASTGLSQWDLAKRLDVHPQEISRWERDKTVPPVPKLRALAREFDCTIDDLIGPDLAPAA